MDRSPEERIAMPARKPIHVEMNEQGLGPASIRQGCPARADLIAGGWSAAEIDAAVWDGPSGTWTAPDMPWNRAASMLNAVLQDAMEAEVHAFEGELRVADFGWHHDGLHVWILTDPADGSVAEFVVRIEEAE
jgi:hypothetical protein